MCQYLGVGVRAEGMPISSREEIYFWLEIFSSYRVFCLVLLDFTLFWGGVFAQNEGCLLDRSVTLRMSFL